MDQPQRISPRRELVMRGAGDLPRYWEGRFMGRNRLKSSRIYKANRRRHTAPPWRVPGATPDGGG
jgi:hypothetical protein